LEVLLLFQGWVSDHILIVQSFFASMVEVLQNLNDIIQIEVWLHGILFFHLFIFDGWWVSSLSRLGVFSFFTLVIFALGVAQLWVALLVFFGSFSLFFLFG